MKVRWLIIPALALIVFGTIERATTSAPTVETTQTAPSAEQLAQKTGCLKCHSVDKKVIGPAYRDIAERYKNKADARAQLIKTVRDGGKGHWTNITGGVPMPPHSAKLSASEIELLVDWVLSR